MNAIVTMNTAIYLIFLCGFLSPFGRAFDSTKYNKTFVSTNKANELFLKRSKRYLVFEKGASIAFQANIAKSIIAVSPRGLNLIAEYTLVYDLPTDYHIFHIKRPSTTTKRIIPTTATTTAYHPLIYYHHDVPNSKDYWQKKNVMQRTYNEKRLTKLKCNRRNFYDSKRTISKICLKRIKRNNIELSELNTSERLFYDLMEKWSLIHDFLPRYCFMRTLCESSHLILPYGHSLLHDIIHILLRHTKPWAIHHKIWGRSLRQHHSRDECAKLYGPYCRVSWLHFITQAVHGSRAADYML